jgi:C4-dicarboxylate transporter, DctM subunit
MLRKVTALVTPLVGLDLYGVPSLREQGPISGVIRGALPFVIGMVALVVLLMAAPDVALWLPNLVMGKG